MCTVGSLRNLLIIAPTVCLITTVTVIKAEVLDNHNKLDVTLACYSAWCKYFYEEYSSCSNVFFEVAFPTLGSSPVHNNAPSFFSAM